MAKEQNLSLNPTKISGICGRLLCCLKFESDYYHECYVENNPLYEPKPNDRVVADDGEGRVVSVNVVRRTATILLDTNRTVVAAWEDIIPSDREIVTNIPLPDNSFRSYFYSIDPKILAYVEAGSPDSLQTASSLIYRNSKGTLTDKEIVLMNVCKQILETAWPSKKITWEVPQIQTENPYMPILQSAANGIYDTNTERTDFLTTLLPAMVVFSKASPKSYFAKAEKDVKAALAMRPDSVLANYIMALLQITQGGSDQAATYLSKAEKGVSSCVELKAVEAAIQFNKGNYSRALSQAEILLESSLNGTLVV